MKVFDLAITRTGLRDHTKRIDVLATALFHGMTIEGSNALDLSYTPLGEPVGRGADRGPDVVYGSAKQIGVEEHMKRLLVLCTGNSARSQMGEGLFRHEGAGRYEVHSAGTTPSQVRPEAIAAMKEIGIDISNHRSKSVSEFSGQSFDYVVTVCDNARDNCPVFPGQAERIHWSFEDPASVEGDDQVRLAAFRRIRDQINERVKAFVRERAAVDR